MGPLGMVGKLLVGVGGGVVVGSCVLLLSCLLFFSPLFLLLFLPSFSFSFSSSSSTSSSSTSSRPSRPSTFPSPQRTPTNEKRRRRATIREGEEQLLEGGELDEESLKATTTTATGTQSFTLFRTLVISRRQETQQQQQQQQQQRRRQKLFSVSFWVTRVLSLLVFLLLFTLLFRWFLSHPLGLSDVSGGGAAATYPKEAEEEEEEEQQQLITVETTTAAGERGAGIGVPREGEVVYWKRKRRKSREGGGEGEGGKEEEDDWELDSGQRARYYWLTATEGAEKKEKEKEGGEGQQRRAFVSLVANDYNVLGGRVLGRSLLSAQNQAASRTTGEDGGRGGSEVDVERVMMITAQVSLRNRELLQQDGWKLVLVPTIDNPFLSPGKKKGTTTTTTTTIGGATGEGRKEATESLRSSSSSWKKEVVDLEERHEAQVRRTALSKLHMFNLVEYEAIFFIDADMLALSQQGSVLKNIFRCVLEPQPSSHLLLHYHHSTSSSSSLINQTTNMKADKGRGGGEEEVPVVCAFQYRHISKVVGGYEPRWLFNSGGVVVRPSEALFTDILRHSRWLGTNALKNDQGLLQSYFFFLCNAERRRDVQVLGDLSQRELRLLECLYPDHNQKNWQSSFVHKCGGSDYRDGSDDNESYLQLLRSGLTNQYTMIAPIWKNDGISFLSEEEEEEQQRQHRELFGVDANLPASATAVAAGGGGSGEEEMKGRKVEVLLGNKRCVSLTNAWQVWSSLDPYARNGTQSVLVHFIDPIFKPWSWRLAPYQGKLKTKNKTKRNCQQTKTTYISIGYYSEWRSYLSDLEEPWRDTLAQSLLWFCFPFLLFSLLLPFLLYWSSSSTFTSSSFAAAFSSSSSSSSSAAISIASPLEEERGTGRCQQEVSTLDTTIVPLIRWTWDFYFLTCWLFGMFLFVVLLVSSFS
jgi:hypothetical protein